MLKKRKGIAEIGRTKYQLSKKDGINLDELNLLAFQELPFLCKCAYERDAEGRQYLVFQGKNSVRQPNGDYVYRLLEALTGLLHTLRDRRLFLGKVSSEADWIFIDPTEIRFTYFPINRFKPITEKEFVLRVLRQYKNEPQCREMMKSIQLLHDNVVLPWLDSFSVQHPKRQAFVMEKEDTTLLSSNGRPVMAERYASETDGWQLEPELPPETEGDTTLLSSNGRPVMAERYASETDGWQPEPELPPETEGDTTLLSSNGRPVMAERYASETDGWQPEPELPPETEGDTTLLSSTSGRLADMQVMPFEERQSINDTEDTSLLSAERSVGVYAPKRQSAPMVALLRCNTGERIQIRGGSLVLGKELSNGCYAIAGNRSVSNRHAAVTLENGKCYLMDMFSTNGSFLEGTRLQPGVKTEVYNGALFSLGTEFFQVVIEG